MIARLRIALTVTVADLLYLKLLPLLKIAFQNEVQFLRSKFDPEHKSKAAGHIASMRRRFALSSSKRVLGTAEEGAK